MVGYAELHCISNFTFLRGASHPAELIQEAVQLGYSALALTDECSVAGVVRAHVAAVEQGLHLIIGSEFNLSDGRQLVLLARNRNGYRSLVRLITRARLAAPKGHYQLSLSDIRHGDLTDCIALLPCDPLPVTGLAMQTRYDRLTQQANFIQELLPEHTWLALEQPTNGFDRQHCSALCSVGRQTDLPLVATGNVHMHTRNRQPLQDILTAIRLGTTITAAGRRLAGNAEHHLRSLILLQRLYPLALLRQSITIAEQCSFSLKELHYEYPQEFIPKKLNATQYLRELTHIGMRSRWPGGIPEPIHRQVAHELSLIEELGYEAYFLTVHDIVQFARDRNILCQGRGSAANSAVCYCLGITEIDPLEYKLVFERFLNIERKEMPDIDMDFQDDRREEAIKYVTEKYGNEHVAQIITFGKLKARAVLRDTGRILQMSYGHVDRLCKMVPNHPTDPWTLPRALNGAADFKREYDNDNEVKRLVDLAMQLEGFPRNSSTHAAGVVIGDRPLAQLVPLYRDPRSDMPVTQYDMKNVESSGLVKFDFLGLKTLSVLKKATDLLKRRDIEIDLSLLPLDDAKVYELMKSGNTVGVFQLESEGMRRTLTAVKPTNFGDIIALVSLYRPGPMDNIPLFGKRKAGQVEIEYPHAKLEGILAETYGIFVYQEQVMQAAQILAGYSLGDADLLRRAMGKKVQAEMDAQRERFVDGCKRVSGIDKGEANALFDLIDKFAGYGFNKSHAAAYALLAYQTAWLKAHYPEEFYAASMCFDMHQSEKLAIFVDDARRSGIKVLPPSLNYSEAEYSVEQTDDGYAVRYALAGIRNVGERAMEAIVDEREAAGRFKSLKDLFERLPKGSMNSRQLEALISAGALDEFEPNRAKLFANADMLLAVADAAERERSSGQGGLFGGEAAPVEDTLRLREVEDWSLSEARHREKENMGFSFKEHATAVYREISSAQGARSHASLIAGGVPGGGRMTAVMAVQVEGASKGTTKRGKPFIRADFSDSSGQFSAACFEEGLVDRFLEWAEKQTCVKLDVELDSPSPDEPPRITVRHAVPLDAVRGSMAMLLTLEVESVDALNQLAIELGEDGAGGDEVMATLLTGDVAPPVMRLGRAFSIDGDLAERLASVPGLAKVQLTARRGKANLRLVA